MPKIEQTHYAGLVNGRSCHWECADRQLGEAQTREARLRSIVAKQAEDESLWFVGGRTAPEAYLQSALRRLHAEIERAALTEQPAAEEEKPAAEGFLARMRDYEPQVCWRLLDEGHFTCIRERGHDGGKHEASHDQA